MCEECKEEIKVITKICSKCGRELPMTSDYFEPREKCKNGFSPKCWECCGRKFGKRQSKQKWTDNDIKILRENYENTTNQKLIEKYFPLRTVSQIVDYASKKLDLHKSKETTSSIFWSKKDENFLKLNYYKMSSFELSKFIDKNPSVINHRANKLGLRKDNGKNLMPFQNIIDVLNEHGIEVINRPNNYNSSCSEFEIKCKKGHTHKTNYTALHAIGFTCIYCNAENYEHKKIEYKELYEMFIVKGYEPQFNKDSYENCKSSLNFICKKHSEYGIQSTNYLSVKNKESSCKYCQLENKMGEKSANWRGGNSNINEFLRTCIYEWKKESMMKCNYTCVITGLRMDVVHHLYNFNKIANEANILSNISSKQEIANYTEQELLKLRNIVLKLHFKYGLGVCLSEGIHQLFHRINGNYDNNIEQFSKFKDDYFKGIYDSELEEEFKSYNSLIRLKENKIKNNLKEVM